jgi:hypothetical protein
MIKFVLRGAVESQKLDSELEQKNAKYLVVILQLTCSPIENLIIPNERAAFLIHSNMISSELQLETN